MAYLSGPSWRNRTRDRLANSRSLVPSQMSKDEGRHRSDQPIRAARPETMGLPPRLFLYALDQVATILDVELATLKKRYIYFEGLSTGIAQRQLLIARNIADKGRYPDWRVAEKELIRWLRYRGFKYVERGWITH